MSTKEYKGNSKDIANLFNSSSSALLFVSNEDEDETSLIEKEMDQLNLYVLMMQLADKINNASFLLALSLSKFKENVYDEDSMAMFTKQLKSDESLLTMVQLLVNSASEDLKIDNEESCKEVRESARINNPKLGARKVFEIISNFSDSQEFKEELVLKMINDKEAMKCIKDVHKESRDTLKSLDNSIKNVINKVK